MLYCISVMLKVPTILMTHLVWIVFFLNVIRSTLCHSRTIERCTVTPWWNKSVSLMTCKCCRDWYKNLSVSAAASRSPERVLYVRLCHHLSAGCWGASVNLSSFQLSQVDCSLILRWGTLSLRNNKHKSHWGAAAFPLLTDGWNTQAWLHKEELWHAGANTAMCEREWLC